jgi:hypothetical protein
MKTKMILMAVAMGAAIQLHSMAADTSVTLTKNIDKPKMGAQVANPFAPRLKTDQYKYNIDRIGGMSSRPWTQIAFSESGGSPVFKDPTTHESQLHLFWFGAEPNP